MDRFPTTRIVLVCILTLSLPGAPAAAQAGGAPAAGAPPCTAEEAKLVASDGQPWDRFGTAVAVWGDTVLVGASAEPGGSGPGAAYVYVREGAGWSQQAALHASDGGGAFGSSVALDAERAVIGAPGHAHGGVTSGSAYVFRRHGAGWSLEAELLPRRPSASEHFGAAVALSGERVVVGAPHDDEQGGSSGAAYVFVHDGAGWNQEAELLASDGASDRQLGRSVAISDGWIAVAAVHELGVGTDAGYVYVYSRVAGAWLERGQLLRSDGLLGQRYGASLAMDGDTALVGAPEDDLAAPSAGAVHVFVRAGDVWSEQAKLVAWDAAGGDYFGISVALSGDTAVIGAHREDDGGTNFFGSAYWYARQDARWYRRLKLRSSSAEDGDELGRAVAVQGATAVAGAPSDDDMGFLSGSATVFHVPPPPGLVYCTCAAGPCGNPDPAAGCANSTALGALLTAHGRTLPDELNLHMVDAPPGQWAVFIHGDDRVLFPFGDGLRCAGHGLVRISVPPVAIGPDGAAAYGPCCGHPTISSRTGVVPGSGTVARYQAWYRDPAGPCGASFNLSNGYEVVW